MKIRVVYCLPSHKAGGASEPRIVEFDQATTLLAWLVEQTRNELFIKLLHVTEVPD